MTDLPCSPAAERNKHPILAALRALLPSRGSALEIASGTGQHAAWFGASLPGWTWQPTEADQALLPVIAAWASAAGLSTVRPALLLDLLASEDPWPPDIASQRFDLVYCANLLHIAPWASCAALMRCAARCLARGGLLVLYGPYLEEGVVTSPGNLAFDENLRARNAAWGLRRLEDVEREARQAGLRLRQRLEMPANNLLLVFNAG